MGLITQKKGVSNVFRYKKGIKVADIARNAGVTHWTIYKVFDGKNKSDRLRQVIADTLGLSYDDLWEKKNTRKRLRHKHFVS